MWQTGLFVVGVAQLVRAPGCGPGGRGFETPRPPQTICAFRRMYGADVRDFSLFSVGV